MLQHFGLHGVVREVSGRIQGYGFHRVVEWEALGVFESDRLFFGGYLIG